MRYDSPELREQLAAEYVLGTLPHLVRRRFERLLADDVALSRMVGDWHARLDPLDAVTAEQEPPARVWQAIERRLELPPVKAAERQNWFTSLAFWRCATFAAAAVAALAFVYIAVRPAPSPTATVVAVLSDDKGEARWIALSGARGGDISVAPIGPVESNDAGGTTRSLVASTPHAFQLWAIAGGKPRSLGLLTPEPGHPLMVQASLVPPGSILAVSIEPPGGSTTGQPTGPVPYKGNTTLPANP